MGDRASKGCLGLIVERLKFQRRGLGFHSSGATEGAGWKGDISKRHFQKVSVQVLCRQTPGSTTSGEVMGLQSVSWEGDNWKDCADGMSTKSRNPMGFLGVPIVLLGKQNKFIITPVCPSPLPFRSRFLDVYIKFYS